MYTSTFIFHSLEYDDEFHARNNEIAERARVIPGFLGEEEWTNEKTGLHSEVYYWDSLESLHQLIGMDAHREAKGRRERWIDSYRVVIAEVLSTYGQEGLGLEHAPAGAAITDADPSAQAG